MIKLMSRRWGNFAGQLLGSSLGGLLGWFICSLPFHFGIYILTNGWVPSILALVLALPLGAPLGAAVALQMRSLALREKESFERALFGAIAGLVAGGLAGAGLVILSNTYGMDWWHQGTEFWLILMVLFIAMAIGAAKGSMSGSQTEQ